MLRLVTAILVSLALAAVALLGWRGMRSERPPIEFWGDMHDQPRYKAQGESGFFADGRTMRTPPAGTVAWGRGTAAPDPRFAVSDAANFKLARMSVPLDRKLLLRGQRLYEVNCAICHGGTGTGDGITTFYGMLNPPSYHSERLRAMPDGEIYQVITQGKGQMGPYAERLDPDDRWAVTAYVRVLQRAFDSRLKDVPPAHREELQP